MQDMHLIGGGGSGGRIFGGGGGERRLRSHHHHAQALKCPRCDSLNTKFCYYNNYNLSQPRHFCRSCNRYWTKGGVLRNVPVGGGCRKSKPSRPKPPPSSKASSRSSSSESSSLTAAATTTAAPSPPSDPRFFLPQPNANPNPDPNPNVGTAGEPIDPRPSFSSSEAPIFAEIGSFTSLITDPALLCFKASSDSPPAPDQSVRSNQNWNLLQKMANSVVGDQEPKVQEIAGGNFDPMVQIELPGAQNRSSSTGLFPPFDWETGGEHNNIFDFSGAVDQGYWTENQWNTDHPLYLP